VLHASVTLLNKALTRLFDLLFAPIDALPPWAGLVVLSIVTAMVVLVAFKWTADQRGLAASKRAMQAGIFEMRLFNDDVVALLRAQGEVLRQTLRYLRYSFAPTLWLVVPLVLVMVQMEFRFGYRGLVPGQPALVTAHVGEGVASMPESASLTVPEGLRVETPAVVLPSAREIVWRIRPDTAGAYDIQIVLDGVTTRKSVVVSAAVARRSPVRPRTGAWRQFTNPSEPPLDASSHLDSIVVSYPEREVTVAGWNVGWAGVYLGLTLLFAYALKGVVGVEM
jgi:uncharacterized membrane protein (DUF106 family)